MNSYIDQPDSLHPWAVTHCKQNQGLYIKSELIDSL